MDDELYPLKGALEYFLENCRVAFCKLLEVNKKYSISHGEELNSWGDFQRILEEYLIVRVASLFDKDTRTVSFENLCSNDPAYKSIKKESIIQYMRDMRHNFVAHVNFSGMINGNFPDTAKILKSNLLDLIKKLEQIAYKY